MNSALLACAVGDIDWLKRSLSPRSNLSTTNREGLNCLQLAAKNGHIHCLRYLLDNHSIKIDVAEVSTGCTALHLSVSAKCSLQRHFQCMKLLLERGAEINKQNKDGQTALHLATRNGHTKCLKKLLEKGAEIQIKENHGHTAYDIATLHSQFECARLLRALQWAKRKDKQLKSNLQEKAEQQRLEQEKKAIKSRLKKEVANKAYQQWTERQAISTRPPPLACEERGARELNLCSSCKTINTRQSSAKTRSPSPTVTATIRLSLHQARRNVECTGKPAKLHPYTNYPPRKSQRTCKSSPNKASSRSGRSSRATNTTTLNHSPSTPITVNIDTKPVIPEYTQQEEKEVEDYTHMEEYVEPNFDQLPPNELNLGFLKNKLSKPNHKNEGNLDDDIEVQFLVGGGLDEDERDISDYEDDEDILAFHDVGKTNSLASLSLPTALTRDHSPAEVIKLLQYLGSSDSSGLPLQRSATRYKRRHSAISFQRRLSLGSIPEGQMVTNYSNESMESLDEQRMRFMELSPRSSVAWEEEEEEDEEESTESVTGEDVTVLSCVSSTKNDAENGTTNDEMNEVEDRDEESVGPLDTRQKTLNIVELVWDTVSNNVQTRITKSPILVHSWPPFTSTRSRSKSTSPTQTSPSQQHSQSSPITTPLNTTSPKPHTPQNNPQSKGKDSNSSNSSSPLTILPSLQDLDDSQEERERDGDLTVHSITTASPNSLATSSVETELQEPSLPAHSLFGNAMGGIASKSMITLGSPTYYPSHTESTSSQPDDSQRPMLLRRKIKSAPNMLNLQQRYT